MPIQSSSYNVYYKDESLKSLRCLSQYSKKAEIVTECYPPLKSYGNRKWEVHKWVDFAEGCDLHWEGLLVKWLTV